MSDTVRSSSGRPGLLRTRGAPAASSPNLFPPPTASQFTLPNGLKVILVPLPDSPVVSTWMWYRVGSAHEGPGTTGAAHWLEHMLFKGSKNFSPGSVDKLIVGGGGNLNAFTDLDFTAYVNVIPKELTDTAIFIEADRMRGATIPKDQLDLERTVVLAEREMNENTPEFRMEEELYGLAYRVHPYRWNTLGYTTDILSMDREHLASFYAKYYGPSNATFVVAGGFDASQMRRQIEKRFSDVKSEEEPTPKLSPEPEQRSNREATLTGPGSTALVRKAWHAPSIGGKGVPETLILGALLGGEAMLYTPSYSWGRSREHPSSLLYASLVDTGLAVSAGCDWQASIYPGLFTIHCRGAPGISPEKIEEGLAGVLERLRRKGISKEELREVQQKFLVNANTVWTGTTMTAFRYGYFSSLGGTSMERDILKSLLKSTVGDVNTFLGGLFDHGMSTVRYVPDRE